MRVKLEDLVAQAVGDPGSIVGGKSGPSWPARHAAHSPTEETVPRWATRAVLTALDNAGALVPTDGRLATFRPGNKDRPTTVTIQLEGPSEILRLMHHMVDWQVDLGSAARAVMVDLRDHMGAASFDQFALMMLGGDRYAKMHDRFLRDFDCQSCEQTIPVGRKFYPTNEAGAVCASCCHGYPPYQAKLVKRVAEPVPVPA